MNVQKSERIEAFVTQIWNWYAVHKRTLPWRDLPDAHPTERAYKVLVSEIMLQQTQVPRVMVVFKSFLERFPLITKLAQASNAEVITAWRGMGYNSRALRLRDAARGIVAKGQEDKRAGRQEIVFPTDMEELLSIPGIGPYTAAAIRNFAFGIPTPCIDTNIRRILHRVFIGPENADGTWEKGDDYLIELAEQVLKSAMNSYHARSSLENTNNEKRVNELTSSAAADWHAALMDFGSLVQTKRNPKWEVCPLTAKGIMKTTKKSYERSAMSDQRTGKILKKEPGREIAGRHVPNRIIRGRVVEALRDAPKGMTLGQLGRVACIDWDEDEHREWMRALLQKLVRDSMIKEEKKKFVLA